MAPHIHDAVQGVGLSYLKLHHQERNRFPIYICELNSGPPCVCIMRIYNICGNIYLGSMYIRSNEKSEYLSVLAN